MGSAPPLKLLLPHPNEITADAGADSGVGKKRSRERAITLAGDEAKPIPSSTSTSVPAALSAVCLLVRIPTTRGALRLVNMISVIDNWSCFGRC